MHFYLLGFCYDLFYFFVYAFDPGIDHTDGFLAFLGSLVSFLKVEDFLIVYDLQFFYNTDKNLTPFNILIPLFLNPDFIKMVYIIQSLPQFYNLTLLRIYHLIIGFALSPQSFCPHLIPIHVMSFLPRDMRFHQGTDLTVCCLGCYLIGVVSLPEDWQFGRQVGLGGLLDGGGTCGDCGG